jgi:hypothetical protein
MSDTHPVQLVVGGDMRRSRLTVLLRLILAIPHYVVLALWGIVAELALIVAWFAGLIMGELPGGLHGFLASFLRYQTRLAAYLLLLVDPYPPFSGGDDPYPVDVQIAPPQAQSRLTIFFRLILAIPALILAYVFRLVNQAIAFLGWFYCLATGEMHDGMANLSAWLLRYEVQTYAYIGLLTERYPALSGAPTP